MAALKFKGQGPAWYPNSVYVLEGHLSQLFTPLNEITSKRCRGITKNTAYALQYLEFLAQVENDLKLSAVLATQTWKAFVIHGCAVIEAIFYYVLVSKARAANTEWQSERKVASPEFDLCGVTCRQEIEFFTKLASPRLIEMTFDAMCKSVEAKKLIKLGDDFYSKLPYLRKLRNRVHIHAIETDAETDYAKFESKDYELMKFVLKTMLTSHLFPNVSEQFDLGFLEPKVSLAATNVS